MAEPSGRRERKKAVTRRNLAESALRLFLERGYESVGIRDVAAEADVAVTTVFSHFASKEALVFGQEQDFERRFVDAVTDRPPHEPVIPALRREMHALVRHCASDEAGPVRALIDGSPALQEYEASMRSRYAESLAAALSGDPRLGLSTMASRTVARFVIDAFPLAREEPEPEAAVDEVFRMIEAAWAVAPRSATVVAH